MEEIPSPPAASALMESTRSVGYSFETAVSDIIDNSISAHARRIWIKIPPGEDPHVTILDDGDGLSLDDLKEAMRYGTDPNRVRDPNDLGRFGLGMKIASLSQCRKLTVVSAKDSHIAACRWDLDRVLETDNWMLQVLSEEELEGLPGINDLLKLENGTLVVWENLDKLKERSDGDIATLMRDTTAGLHDHLRLTFHRFMDPLSKDHIEIYLNGSKLTPCDPFLSGNTQTKAFPEEKVSIEGQTVTVKAYILPVESKLTPEDIDLMGGCRRSLQGFWVYRNKRLIIPGTWFKLTNKKELTKLARVRVDIPNTLDSVWDIDVKKSSAVIPLQFRKAFSKVLEEVTGNSERRYVYRGRKESDSENIMIWDRTRYQKVYRYQVNLAHPIIKSGYDELNKDQQKWFRDTIRLIETYFPYDDMFNLMSEAKLQNAARKSEEEENSLYMLGLLLLQNGTSMDEIRKMQPFMGNDALLEKLSDSNGTRGKT